jgi:UDP-glucose 4-epimerase
MFVQKAPAAKVSTLAQALLELYDSKSPIHKIGIRHGEKKYETLVTSEEMVKANDLGKYYSIGSDNRDLNYAPYFSEGNDNNNHGGEYNSNNAEQLDVSKMKKLLMQLPELKNDPLIKL